MNLVTRIRNKEHEITRWLAFTLILLVGEIPNTFSQSGEHGWEAIGPWGTDVQALVISPGNSNILYAGDPAGFLYRTLDQAMTWQHIAPLGVSVRCLVLHPVQSQVVYAGADLLGVMRSDNGGKSWNSYKKGLKKDPFVYALAIDPVHPNTLYAGTFKSKGTGGVYKSTDAGKTWLPVSNGMRDHNVLTLTLDPRNPNVLYASTFKGKDRLYRSNDGGASWKIINEGLPDTDIYAIAVHPQKSNILYVATGGKGVFKSENGGATWRPVNQGLTNQIITQLVVDPHHPQRVYAGAMGLSKDKQRGSFLGAVFKSEDRGETWHLTVHGMTIADVRAIKFDPFNPEVIYAGVFDFGVFMSPDGGKTWNSNQERRNLGLTDPQILDLSPDPEIGGTLVAACLNGGIFKSVDWGTHWRQVWNKGRVQVLLRPPDQPNVLWAATFPEGIIKSEDRGETWKKIGLDIPGIFTLAIHPNNPNILYAGINASPPDGGVYKTEDGGKTWQKLNNGITNTLIRAIAIHPQNPDIVYAGTLQQSKKRNPPKLYRSTDGGAHWAEVTNQVFETFVLLIDPARPNILYSGKLVSGVFRSIDGGVTWEDVNEGMGNPNVLAMAFKPDNSNILYAGTVKGGIFRRDFTRENSQPPGTQQATNNTGRPRPYLSAFWEENGRRVIIEYGLLKPGKIALDILDRHGRIVTTLKKGEKPPGYYRAEWDGRDVEGNYVESGVYICRLWLGYGYLYHKIAIFR